MVRRGSSGGSSQCTCKGILTARTGLCETLQAALTAASPSPCECPAARRAQQGTRGPSGQAETANAHLNNKGGISQFCTSPGFVASPVTSAHLIFYPD
ncbi:unnamed protein product [Coccothraustes coccothraustes]